MPLEQDGLEQAFKNSAAITHIGLISEHSCLLTLLGRTFLNAGPVGARIPLGVMETLFRCNHNMKWDLLGSHQPHHSPAFMEPPSFTVLVSEAWLTSFSLFFEAGAWQVDPSPKSACSHQKSSYSFLYWTQRAGSGGGGEAWGAWLECPPSSLLA